MNITMPFNRPIRLPVCFSCKFMFYNLLSAPEFAGENTLPLPIWRHLHTHANCWTLIFAVLDNSRQLWWKALAKWVSVWPGLLSFAEMRASFENDRNGNHWLNSSSNNNSKCTFPGTWPTELFASKSWIFFTAFKMKAVFLPQTFLFETLCCWNNLHFAFWQMRNSRPKQLSERIIASRKWYGKRDDWEMVWKHAWRKARNCMRPLW